MGVNTPFDGISAQSHPLNDIRRCYPSSSCSGIVGNSIRIPQVNSDVSCNGVGFSESFRFQKVLQGQEILPSQPYGRSLSVNEARANGRYGILDNSQLLSSRSGWSAQMQDNQAHLHPNVPPGQASSPSSVLMFQQAVNPVSNCDYNNSIKNHGFEGKMMHASEIKGGRFVPSSSFEPSFYGQSQGGTNPHNQLDASPSQELVSSCKRSCRLFGFSLTQENHIANEEANNPSELHSQLSSGPSLIGRVGDEIHPRLSLRCRVVGSNCTKVS